jgi:hypothetical protein
MPGGQDQHDRIHALSPSFSGKRKTDRLSPRKLGDNKAPDYLRIPIADTVDELADDVGQIAFLTGDGPKAEGLYVRKAAGWTAV